LTRRLKQLQSQVIDFFYPRVCLGCGKIGDFVCIRCENRLKRIYPPLCQRCGRPETSGTLCRECWSKQGNIDLIRSVFIFEGIIRDAVHALKYNNLRAIAGRLGRFMAEYYTENKLAADILLPVPLHESRMRQRGYNQSELLAREVSSIINVPVYTDPLVRIRNNRPQTHTANAEERRSNVRDAFKCQEGRVEGKNIVLIDDVCTTGATLEACATALKAQRAGIVLGFTLAREI